MKHPFAAVFAVAAVIGAIAGYDAQAQDKIPQPAVRAVAAIQSDKDASAQPSVLPPRPDNAAINYLLALTLLHHPADAEEQKAREFLDNEFGSLPPEALADRPDAETYLSKESYASGPCWPLNEGALKPTCHFDIDWSTGPGAQLPHLAALRNLAREARAIAKYKIFTGQHAQAAEIDADLIRMGAHLGEDPVIIHGLVGVAVQVIGVDAAMGLLASDPPRDAVETLMTGLQRTPSEPFNAANWVRGEAESYSNWFIAHPKAVFSDASTTEITEEQRVRAIHAIATYKRNLLAAADAMEGRYYESMPRLGPLDEKIQQQVKANKEDVGVILLSQIMPAYLRIPREVARADAQLGMLRILTAAAMWKAETGAYPDTLEPLKKYFPDGLPTDPFTGKDFVYSFQVGFPRVECAAPEDVMKTFGTMEDPLALDLGRRIQKDAAALAEFRQKQAEGQ